MVVTKKIRDSNTLRCLHGDAYCKVANNTQIVTGQDIAENWLIMLSGAAPRASARYS